MTRARRSSWKASARTSATSRRSRTCRCRSAQGEFFSLLGPSGCGKTTTLRLIAGFEQPTTGAIRLDGEDVASVPPYKRNVNTVFQSYALFEHLDVAENIAFGLRRRKVPKPEIEQRVSEALDLVSLGHRAKDRPAQLSGGMRQRVALARALVNRPVAAAARRAARRARPQAAQADAGRAQADPARGRHHVHLRDARPGGGARDVRPDRRHARRRGRAARRARGDLRAPGEGVRGRLHRHLEPAAGRRRERRRAALERPARSPRRCPTGSRPAPRCSSRSGPRSCWIDELEDGMATVEGTIAERVYLGTTTQLIVELGPERARRRARAEHRAAPAPTTAGSSATGSGSAGSRRTARSCADAAELHRGRVRARARRRPGAGPRSRDGRAPRRRCALRRRRRRPGRGGGRGWRRRDGRRRRPGSVSGACWRSPTGSRRTPTG